MPSTTSTALIALLSAAGNAHMIMKTPQPFTFPDPANQLAPLLADGSDFPCKIGAGAYTAAGARTQMAIGAPQTLSFTGTAVHGGGSCQLALTTDKAPTPDTEWMVIHSIEGGCPARNQAGNLPEGSESQDTYEYTIPAGIEPGEYTFAWTWFNRIGNREMYMNCAPIEVTAGAGGAGAGGAAKRDVQARRVKFSQRQSSFPDIFRANIGANSKQCTTEAAASAGNLGAAISFPNPGDSVDQPEGADGLFAQDCDGGSGGSSSGSASGPTGGAATNATVTGGSFEGAADSVADSVADNVAAVTGAATDGEAGGNVEAAPAQGGAGGAA